MKDRFLASYGHLKVRPDTLDRSTKQRYSAVTKGHMKNKPSIIWILLFYNQVDYFGWPEVDPNCTPVFNDNHVLYNNTYRM